MEYLAPRACIKASIAWSWNTICMGSLEWKLCGNIFWSFLLEDATAGLLVQLLLTALSSPSDSSTTATCFFLLPAAFELGVGVGLLFSASNCSFFFRNAAIFSNAFCRFSSSLSSFLKWHSQLVDAKQGKQ
jgi:hypothetical protein